MPLDVQRSFNLDQLPVSFGTKLARLDGGSTAPAPIDSAMKEMLDIIWRQGGFRFVHRDTTAGLSYRYYCSQDKAREQKSRQKHRDVQRMRRFDCKSKLVMCPNLENRTMSLHMYHKHHGEYFDKHFSAAVLDFIRERIESLPPAEIFRDLKAAGVPGSDSATMDQVYYRYVFILSSVFLACIFSLVVIAKNILIPYFIVLVFTLMIQVATS